MTGASFHSKTQRALPLWAYLAIYIPTCLIGAGLFIIEHESFIDFYEYFSGAAIPRLNAEQRHDALMLLFVGPALFAVGFLVATSRLVRTRLPHRRIVEERDDVAIRRASWIAFGLSTLVAIVTLRAAEAFSNAGAWLDHAQMVNARWTLFSSMNYFGFVNIYIVLPVLAAWAATRSSIGSLWRWLFIAAACAAIPVIANGLLFQKRPVVISLLIFGSVVALFLRERRRRLANGMLAGALTAAAVAYFALVVLPSFQETSQTIKQAEELLATQEEAWAGGQGPVVSAPDVADEERLVELAGKLNLSGGRQYQLIMYSLMAPLSRTSSSALFYPIVFPDHHPYYGVDLGLDVLGFGSMPSHGSVVYQYMNPGIPGSTSAPYQFVLYSQVGLTGALIGSFIIGISLGLGWVVAQFAVPDAFRAPASGIVIVLAIYAAMDSFRDAVISSYGVIWPAAALAGVWALVRLFHRSRRVSGAA